MRAHLIEKMKSEIEQKLKDYLREEGIELYVAGNDNGTPALVPHVELEALEGNPLEGTVLLSEIRVILGILGKPAQCEVLVKGIYEALHPHYITHHELTVLLMSLHVETLHCVRPRHMKKRAVMCYIMEELCIAANDEPQKDAVPEVASAEYC